MILWYYKNDAQHAGNRKTGTDCMQVKRIDLMIRLEAIWRLTYSEHKIKE